LFNNGDEFSVRLRVSENWDRSEPIFNIRRHFEQSINLASTSNLLKFSLLKTLRFYVPTDTNLTAGNSAFTMNSSTDGLLYAAVGFDYEQARAYSAKVLVVQEAEAANFTYWLDVSVEVTNVVDEAVVCGRPIYVLEIAENQVKNKKLLTLDLKDFEASGLAEERFSAEIVSGNEAGLFGMNGLGLFTGGTRRRLDRETMDHHELEVVVREAGTLRERRCVVNVQLSDLNDNRPIVNDVELVVYDKLDTRFVNFVKFNPGN